MNIQVGTKFNDRLINIEVGTQDALEVFGEKWNTWKFGKKFKMLSTYADSLVVKYLADNHVLSSEQAQSRMAALQELLRQE